MKTLVVPVMRLADVEEGSRVRIISVPEGDLGNLLRSRGLHPGSIVVVLNNRKSVPWSPIILEVRGFKIAIGRDVASSILVENIGESV